jgi:hypothetical protein
MLRKLLCRFGFHAWHQWPAGSPHIASALVSDDWKNKFEALVREMTEVPYDMGIYPQAMSGMGAEKDYKERDGYKNGWNAAVMEYGKKLGEAAYRAAEGIDDNLSMLLASDIGWLRDGVLYLNMNDVWGWACADAEKVPKDKVDDVAELYKRWGWAGLLYWVSKQRGGERSEFKDVNRYINFVAREEKWREMEPSSSKRAYNDIPATV